MKTTFHDRKATRTKHLQDQVFGWKLRDCLACAGTGHYDASRSPKCTACEGTGKERFKPTAQ